MAYLLLFENLAYGQWIQTICPCSGMVWSLAVRGSTIFAGTGSGVWQRPLSEMIETGNVRPQREISNPIHFNIDPLSSGGSILAIEFTIPRSDRVAIKLYDLAGRELAFIVNKQLNAGSYKYLWDSHALARGSYAVRMQVGATACIKRIQVVH